MLYYAEEEVKAIAEMILRTQVKLRPIGNHELKRHLVYHLTNEVGLSIVFKLYYKKNRWNTEVGILKLLDNSSIKHPKIIKYGILEDDREWLMISYIDGNTLDTMKDQILLSEKIKVIGMMGEELGKIHSLKTFDYFGSINEDGSVTNLGYDNYERLQKKLNSLSQM